MATSDLLHPGMAPPGTSTLGSTTQMIPLLGLRPTTYAEAPTIGGSGSLATAARLRMVTTRKRLILLTSCELTDYLANGHYFDRWRFAALRPFGDPTVSEDWNIYKTPQISVLGHY